MEPANTLSPVADMKRSFDLEARIMPGRDRPNGSMRQSRLHYAVIGGAHDGISPERRRTMAQPQSETRAGSQEPSGAHWEYGQAAANDDRFRHLVEQSPAITWIVDADGVITYVNPRLAEYIGADPPRTMDEWAHKFLHPDDVPLRLQAWERARTTGEPYDVELRIRRHDGAYHCFLSRALPVRDESGRVVEWMGTSTDIQAL